MGRERLMPVLWVLSGRFVTARRLAEPTRVFFLFILRCSQLDRGDGRGERRGAQGSQGQEAQGGWRGVIGRRVPSVVFLRDGARFHRICRESIGADATTSLRCVAEPCGQRSRRQTARSGPANTRRAFLPSLADAARSVFVSVCFAVRIWFQRAPFVCCCCAGLSRTQRTRLHLPYRVPGLSFRDASASQMRFALVRAAPFERLRAVVVCFNASG